MALSQSSMQPPRQHSLILEREIPQITRRTNRSQFSFHHPSPMSVPEPIDVYDTDSRHDKTPHNLFNVSSSLLSALARAHRQFSPTGSLTRQTKAPHASSASRLLSNPSFDLIDLSFLLPLRSLCFLQDVAYLSGLDTFLDVPRNRTFEIRLVSLDSLRKKRDSESKNSIRKTSGRRESKGHVEVTNDKSRRRKGMQRSGIGNVMRIRRERERTKRKGRGVVKTLNRYRNRSIQFTSVLWLRGLSEW